MRFGIASNWDGQKRRFLYFFEPGDNDTLEIIELEDKDYFSADLPCNRELHEMPGEVQAEINISMGHAGMMLERPTWWGNKKAWLWRFRQQVHLRWIRLTRRPT